MIIHTPNRLMARWLKGSTKSNFPTDVNRLSSTWPMLTDTLLKSCTTARPSIPNSSLPVLPEFQAIKNCFQTKLFHHFQFLNSYTCIMSIVQTFLKCTSYYGNKKNGVFTIYYLLFFRGFDENGGKTSFFTAKNEKQSTENGDKKKEKELNLYYPECADYLAKEYIARCRDASIYPTSVTEIHVNQPPPQRERELFLYK